MKFYSYYFKTFIQKIYASCIIKETFIKIYIKAINLLIKNKDNLYMSHLLYIFT